MLIEILKSILVGIIAALPVGIIFVMVVQKTLCRGRSFGFAVGYGAALADGLYATIGLFTLKFVQSFVENHKSIILIVGGVIILAIAALMFFKDVKMTQRISSSKYSGSLISCTLQSFCSVLSNPVALAVMLALLSSFSLEVSNLNAPVFLIVCGVVLGEALYWTVVASLISRFLKLNEKVLRIISKVAGAIIAAFAVFVIIKGVISL